jgi:hypothetical protein
MSGMSNTSATAILHDEGRTFCVRKARVSPPGGSSMCEEDIEVGGSRPR